MSEENVVIGEAQARESATNEWTFEGFRIALNNLTLEARQNGLKLDECLAGIEMAAKSLQVQYEVAIVTLINEEKNRKFAEELDKGE